MIKNKLKQENKTYDIMLRWLVTRVCNLDCPQCTARAVKLTKDNLPEKINITKLKGFLKTLNKTAKFSFTGGEPLLIPNIIEVFTEITKNNYITLISNLINSKVKKIAEIINPDRVFSIIASAHLLELEHRKLLEKFINNCKMLKEKGFDIYIPVIAYPYLINEIDKYIKMFNNHGLQLSIIAFKGTWENKTYPKDYTEHEIKIFGLQNEYSANMKKSNWKNKFCNAGYNIAVIMEDGNIYPCFEINSKLGSIDEGLKLNKTIYKCMLDYCNCPLPSFEPYLYMKSIKENSRKIMDDMNMCFNCIR